MQRIDDQIRAKPSLLRLMRSPKPKRQAVIDIGSNSVRLIVYSVSGRSMIPKINEKVMAGLGRNLMQTGKLSEEGVELAQKSILRFHAICESLGVTDVKAFATAAVREALNGGAFTDWVKRETGYSVQVLSGTEEAYYAAMGVIAAQRDPNGLIGDLGGSSLELVSCEKGNLTDGVTYKLGPLALQQYSELGPKDLQKKIVKTLKENGELQTADTFYAVGGAWRALAKVHMHWRGYDLHVLQSYNISTEDVFELCEKLDEEGSDLQSLAKRVSGKRYATIGLTSAVLKAVLKETQAKQVMISTYGVREGMVFASMKDDVKRLDPLIAGAVTVADVDTTQLAFIKALSVFLEDVLGRFPSVFRNEYDLDMRLYQACFVLSDIGASMHPDHRADIARQIVLRAPYTGVDHAARVFVGLVTGFRYYRKFSPTDLELSVLSEEQIERARVLGHLIRLAAAFSGRTEKILRRGGLKLTKDHLILHIAKGHSKLVSEGVEKRLTQAASTLGVEPLVEI